MDGCENRAQSRGWCGKHYMRWRTWGDPLGGRQRGICAVDGCEEPHRAKGYCAIHYARWKRTGDPGPPERQTFPLPAECTVDGCTKAPSGKGLCPMHYSRLLRHGNVDANPKPVRGQCEVIGCGRPHAAKGYCSRHYWMQWKHGEPEPGGYSFAHRKVYRLRGAASQHTCGHCGTRQARDWAYDHQDPDQRYDPRRGGPFSTDPWHYIPLCTSCHRILDNGEASR